ncbi:uncharacterized protein MYCFIDRAFT_211398 [Pseudocercospora fijiensis CIRAD86]|uniref:Uncharacterized protein n=1 Tax=Pseudocercospora fijiensis (strain CIRAD86) TaxID=383855 RepID=M2Z1K1_PSEFD|nr:uncharacterized protein MYCFIDRAFT_211398 [Pseudocercospora fijiensis CIRAD86]EME83705.1 hypothetical protein MYCFIDRAFT_211398 [Pseudocercospora fijiensis CIRAD86]
MLRSCRHTICDCLDTQKSTRRCPRRHPREESQQPLRTRNHGIPSRPWPDSRRSLHRQSQKAKSIGGRALENHAAQARQHDRRRPHSSLDQRRSHPTSPGRAPTADKRQADQGRAGKCRASAIEGQAESRVRMDIWQPQPQCDRDLSRLLGCRLQHKLGETAAEGFGASEAGFE